MNRKVVLLNVLLLIVAAWLVWLVRKNWNDAKIRQQQFLNQSASSARIQSAQPAAGVPRASAADYIDVARGRRGAAAMRRLLEGDAVDHPPFAVPVLQDGDVTIAQAAAILLYLAPRLGLAPEDETGRLWASLFYLRSGMPD